MRIRARPRIRPETMVTARGWRISEPSPRARARSLTMPSPHTAVDGLIREEERLESARTAADTTYSVMRHIDVLIALMAEIRGLTPVRALPD